MPDPIAKFKQAQSYIHGEFDVGAGIARMKQDYDGLAYQIAPELEKVLEKAYHRKLKWDPITSLKNMPGHWDTTQARLARGMNNLVAGKYFHSLHDWPEIRWVLDKEGQQRYARLAIEEAKRGSTSESVNRLWNPGNAWIIENVENGKLSDFISPLEVSNIAKDGFWELMQGYVTRKNRNFSGTIPKDYLSRYEAVLKHLNVYWLNDPIKIKELEDNPLTPAIDEHEIIWPDKLYIKLVDRLINAQRKSPKEISKNTVAHYIKPIVESEIMLRYGSPFPTEIAFLIPDLMDDYGKFMGTAPIQSLLRDIIIDGMDKQDIMPSFISTIELASDLLQSGLILPTASIK